jgi:hypothetical protein
MATYTLEITGASTYTFDVQPEFDRVFDYEHNEDVTPPALVAELETWHLKNAVFRGASSAVTDDFETLRGILGDRLTPVSSVVFKRDGAAVWTLAPNGGLLVKGFSSRHEPGHWAGYWKGDLTVLGRRLLADAQGIVRIAKKLSYTYDASGLAVVELSGTLTTAPGTSAEAKARDQALQSPGADYGLMTQGPGGGPNVDVLDASDTRASWKSAWKQHGVTLPAGVNEYSLTVETVDDPDSGQRVTTQVSARGLSATTLKSVVEQKKPGTALGSASFQQDATGRSYRGTFVQEAPSASTQAALGGSLVYRRIDYRIEGIQPADDEERDDEVYLVPGATAFFVKRPRSAITLVERIVTRVRGRPTGLDAFDLDSRAKDAIEGLRLQPGKSAPPVAQLEKRGLTDDANLWRGEAVYHFLAAELDAAAVFDLAVKQ